YCSAPPRQGISLSFCSSRPRPQQFSLIAVRPHRTFPNIRRESRLPAAGFLVLPEVDQSHAAFSEHQTTTECLRIKSPDPLKTRISQECFMKLWIGILSLLACVSLVAFANPHVRPSTTTLTENDFRKLEQVWLDAASVPDLPVLQKLFSDDFMGT